MSSDPSALDVVVPIYGAARELERCLTSLHRHTDLERHRIVATLDGPQSEEIEGLLASLPAGTLILRHPRRTGFVANANRGMRASERDVVLLNSDTEVTALWLEKLAEAAASDPAIGTVTPFSNSATLASLPHPFERNALPAGWSLDRFAALVQEVSLRQRPELPTGVGFCLYVKRQLLREVGFFDEASFGAGYGEENDLCLRAAAAGYRSVLDDATFVYHAGGASFGAAATERQRAGAAALRRLHPGYESQIAAFMNRDPLRPIRERVVQGLVRATAPRSVAARTSGRAIGGPRSVVHLVHGWPPWSPAGTETYARRLALRQTALRKVAVYARRSAPERPKGEALELWDEGVRVRLVANDFTQRNPLSRNGLWDGDFNRDFARFLDRERPDLLHVHHLAGHAMSLIAVAAWRRLPILFQIQDWWTPCARANLLDRDRRLCSGPAPGKCSRCLPATALPPEGLTNRLLYAARGVLGRWALARADALVMGSEAIRKSYEELGLLPTGAPCHVLPYGIERPIVPTPAHRRVPGSPLRFGFIGSLLQHKGADLALRAFRAIAPERAQLHLWGDPDASPAYALELAALRSPAVSFEGRFDEALRGEVFGSIDVLLVPSRGLESFGLVAYEALAEGIPVLASHRGALADLFNPLNHLSDGPPYGALFDPDSPHELTGWIERLAADPAILDGWRAAAAKTARVKSMDRHAEEMEAIYRRLVPDSP